MEIVKNSAKDCYPAVQKTTLVIMERLQQVLQMEVGSNRERRDGRERKKGGWQRKGGGDFFWSVMRNHVLTTLKTSDVYLRIYLRPTLNYDTFCLESFLY